jgi:hypothetical protein
MEGKIIAAFLILVAFSINAQDVGGMFAKQNPDSVRNELKGLFVELSIKHPGFYRYNEKGLVRYLY